MPSVAAGRVCAPVFPVAEERILIRKVSDPGGWLSNMSPHPIADEAQKWWHAEALFQALRFALEDEEVREAVRAPRSPMKDKMIAKRFKARQVVVPLSEADVENQRDVPAIEIGYPWRSAPQVACQWRKAAGGGLQCPRPQGE